MANKLIYLDNAATTHANQEVLRTYNQVVETYFANPSSIHFEGQKANRLLDKAREQISNCFNLPNHSVIFTSGATEGNNIAIKGIAMRYQGRGKHIVTTNVEHPSVLETVKQLEELFGFDVTYLSVNSEGKINASQVKEAINENTILVSVMAVNNETGAINPIEEIASILKSYPKITFHVDATQAIGKIAINYQNVDLITFSSHKIHGLNGSGVLLKNKKTELIPLINGGGQEFGYRSGTNDTANIVATATAVRLSFESMKDNFNYLNILYRKLMKYFKTNEDLYEINSYDNNPYVLNISLKTKKASVVVEALSNLNIMVSSTSACHSKNETGSYVIKAMGKEERLYNNTIRVSLDASNTSEEIETFIISIDKIVKEVKE